MFVKLASIAFWPTISSGMSLTFGGDLSLVFTWHLSILLGPPFQAQLDPTGTLFSAGEIGLSLSCLVLEII